MMLKVERYQLDTIPGRFRKSPLGRSLGVHGEDAQKLGLYLLANPYLDTSGHYNLPFKAITAHTGLRYKRLKRLLHTLRGLGFCTYHFEKQQVSVPLVTQIYAAVLNQGSPWDADPQMPSKQETNP